MIIKIRILHTLASGFWGFWFWGFRQKTKGQKAPKLPKQSRAVL